MGRKSVYTKLLLVFLLGTAVFAACTTNIEPTPESSLAEVVTVSVERPLATTTPQPSITPTATMPLLETAVPTSTPSPTVTQASPTPTETPYSSVSRPILSRQGQLAFIKNQTLFVETAVGTGEFQEVARFVNDGEWANDGERIALYISNVPNVIDNENIALWDRQTNTVTYLTNLIADFPPAFPEENNKVLNLENIKWSPSNTKILFTVWEQLEPGIGGVWVADFNDASFDLEINGYSTKQSWWLDENTILVGWHCGAPCEGLTAYSNGEIIWELPWQTGGFFTFSSNHKFLINAGRVMGREPFATVEEIDLATGEIKIIWQATEPGYFPLFPINLSPDDNFISFHFGGSDPFSNPGTLYVIDRSGRSYGQRPNSVIMDWRPDGGPVVKEYIEDEQTQLVYWPLDGAAVRVFVSPKTFEFGEGKWSGDGRFFIYSAVDEAENKSYAYLWQPESGVPILLHAADGTDGFGNFAWLPDSTGVYFNLGREELWKFEVESELLTLIASSAED